MNRAPRRDLAKQDIQPWNSSHLPEWLESVLKEGELVQEHMFQSSELTQKYTMIDIIKDWETED